MDCRVAALLAMTRKYEALLFRHHPHGAARGARLGVPAAQRAVQAAGDDLARVGIDCRVAVVDCSEQTQIERTMSRSGLSRAAVERILAAQATRAQRIAAADDVIGNEGSIADLDEQVRALHAAYMEAALAGC